MSTLQRHPLSALFSGFDLAGEDQQALAEDIKANGQIQPITLHEGMVLDGWNRLEACKMAKVKPVTVQFAGKDPWVFVCSSNMHRRHMTAAERFGVMALYFKMMGQDDRSKLTVPTVKQIEKTLDVSHGTAVKGQQILKAADPDVAEALAKKEISLDRAAVVSKMPQEERKDAIKAPLAPKTAPDASAARLAQLERLLTERDQEIKGLRERLDEMAHLLEGAQADNEAMEKVINADNRLTAMMAEAARSRAEARLERTQKNGLMVGNHDLAGKLKAAQRRIKVMEAQAKGVELAPDPEVEDDLLEVRDDIPSFDEVG